MPIMRGWKCGVVWCELTAFLITLVVYLDGGPESVPHALLFVLFLSDVISLLSVGWSVWSSWSTEPAPPRFQNTHDVYAFFRKHLGSLVQIVCILLKACFEVFLLLNLVFLQRLPLWLVLLPVWIILAIAIADLSRRLVNINRKAKP